MKKRNRLAGKRMIASAMAVILAGGLSFGRSGMDLQASSAYFSMVETEITLMVDETDFIEVDLAADISYTESSLTWSSSDSSIVSVDTEGIITGMAEGEADITASMPDGSSETCHVTVSGYMNDEDIPDPDPEPEPDPEIPPISSLSLPKQVTIYVKENTFMEISYEPEEADEETITWKSSNPNVATVNESGLVTGIKTGTVQIIAMTPEDITATCTVTVQKPQIKLEKNKARVKVGKRVLIRATCYPDAKPKFKSQNKSIATVTTKGLVKARKKGKTVIVVKANGVSKKFNVTVVR